MATDTLPAPKDHERAAELMRIQLESISAAANTISIFAALAADRAVGDNSAYDFHALQAMAERVGAIAEIRFHREIAVHLVGVDAADVLTSLEEEASHG